MPKTPTCTKLELLEKPLSRTSEVAIAPTQPQKVKFQDSRPADLTDIPCYEFTPRDIEAIQPEPKTRFPKVVRPADLTNIPCYEFTPSDLEAQLNFTKGANCSNK